MITGALRRLPSVARLGTAAALLLAGAAAEASAADYQYKFYLGGVLIGKAEVATDIADDAYTFQTRLRSDGVVGFFYDLTIAASAEGRREGEEGDGLTPLRFGFNSVAEGEKLDLEMPFDGNAPERVTAEPPFDPRPWEIEPTAQSGALDPISAIVSALLPSPSGDVCHRTIPVYDGRRRYDIVFDGARKARRGRDGEVDCKVRYKRVAGFKPKYMTRPDIPFFVRFLVSEDGEALPIRAWADTDFGAATATLVRR